MNYSFPNRFKNESDFVPVDYSYVHSELKKVGVTLKLLWEEYVAKCKVDGLNYCSYCKFTKDYKGYSVKRNFTSHLEHKPGIDVEVDWSGPTMSYVNNDTGEIITAYLFVGTLPYSQYSYVEATPSMDQNSWLSCHVNMFNYFEGTPIKIICDNLKTGVISHPTKGEIILNEAYLTLGEYYKVAILPTGVRKPKEKPSVEGTVGKIATQVIAALRNDTFYSLEALNKAILNKVNEMNEKPFQKREGSRKIIFELEEKPYLKKLPLVPYEVCDWSYSHKVMYNSYIIFRGNYYSVPHKYISSKVDIKYNNYNLYIYHNKELLATHAIFSFSTKGKYKTIDSHLPEGKKFKQWTIESICDKASSIGVNTRKVIDKLFEEAKIKEQAFTAALAVLQLAREYTTNEFEQACGIALENYNFPHHKHIKLILNNKVKNENKNDEIKIKKKGLVRGSDYYKED